MVYKQCPDIILQEPYALFCDEDDNGCHLEVFPRNNGEIYVCGCGGSDIMGECTSGLLARWLACLLLSPLLAVGELVICSYILVWGGITVHALQPPCIESIPFAFILTANMCHALSFRGRPTADGRGSTERPLDRTQYRQGPRCRPLRLCAVQSW
jgi:hypothetical protein